MAVNSSNIQDSYNLFIESAKLIPNWNKIDKNELVNRYIEYEEKDKQLAGMYMAAIICRYWPKIQRFYKMTSFSASYEDIYDLLINSILRAIKARRWLQEDSSIYGDPTGPDKAINRTMICERLNFLAFQNRSKRSANLNPMYIDEAEDDTGDYLYNNLKEIVSFEKVESDLEIVSNLQFLYSKKLYLSMFIYYAIVFNLGVFKNGKFSVKFCASALSKIDDFDLEDIANLLEQDSKIITKQYNLVVASKNRSELKLNIEYSMLKLKELYMRETI